MGSISVLTPLGFPLFIESDGKAISRSQFVRGRTTAQSSDSVLQEAARQVAAYFARRLKLFELPLIFTSGNSFERKVWRAVAQLRFGEFVSYADVARAVGHPRSHRGVAATMRKSPLDLFVPAHRVIGADGRLKGCAADSVRARLAAFEGTGRIP
ncbi:MAG: methylated-DNA--[protein]-cysteine S-methyltransferase [Candidatus Eremiobacteraeota bacterium]|nr:methylated-DNA--[protein]-cysteine S-methyltransferase [Candidatus Eremiobacteraeota bacterium]